MARNYIAEYARRIARGFAKGLTRSQARGHPKPHESAISPRKHRPLDDERLQRALRTLRQEKSLGAAAKAARVSPERLKHAAEGKGAISKEGRRWVVSPNLPRRMLLYTRGRRVIIIVPDASAATLVGEFMSAVGKFLASNDRDLLTRFVGQSVTDTAGKQHPFELDPNVLHRLASVGGETFEQVYRIVI